MIFSGEENNGCNNVQIIRDKFAIEIRKSEEGADSLDRGGELPILDGREFCGVHVDKSLANDHPQVFHGGGVERAFGDFKR